MRFKGTAKVGTDPFSQLARGQQAVMLDHVALGMHLLGFNGIELGALRGQQEGQNPHAFCLRFGMVCLFTDPS
jgi:hypothetical protein